MEMEKTFEQETLTGLDALTAAAPELLDGLKLKAKEVLDTGADTEELLKLSGQAEHDAVVDMICNAEDMDTEAKIKAIEAMYAAHRVDREQSAYILRDQKMTRFFIFAGLLFVVAAISKPDFLKDLGSTASHAV